MTAPPWYTGPHAGVNNRRVVRNMGKKRGNPEHKIQVALCDYLAFAAKPDIHYFAIPNQSNRHIANAARMKAEGVRAGSPDMCFLLPGGRVGWLEMKAPNGSLSPEQKLFRGRAQNLDHYWAMARSVDEALVALTQWGVLKKAYEVTTS